MKSNQKCLYAQVLKQCSLATNERERERESSSRLICHTERSEVSQAKQKRDISLALNMTKNKNTNVQNPLDISVSTKPQYDDVKKSHNPKSRKLALSLATASIIVGASLELAAAACVQKRNNGTNFIDCTGTMTATEIQNGTSNKNMLINLGRGEGNPLNVGAGTVSISNSNLTIFRGVNAANTDFTITGSGDAGVLLPYTLGNHQTNASTIRNLTIDGTLNNTSWGSKVVYRQFLDVDIHAGTQILGTLTNNATLQHAMAIYGGYEGTDRSTYVNKFTNNGTIASLYLGYHQFAGDFASILGSYKIEGGGAR